MAKEDDADNGDDKAVLHTLDSVEFTYTELSKSLEQIRVYLELMKTGPRIESLRIHRESSRVNGLRRVVSWADALRDAVSKAKDDLLKPVSDSKNGAEKQRKKTT